MKSQLFSRFNVNGPANTDIKNDLAVLSSLTAKQAKAILKELPALNTVETEDEQTEIEQKLAKALDMTIVSLESINSLTGFFLRMARDKDTRADKVDDWVADLMELKLIQPSQAKRVAAFIDALKQQVEPATRGFVDQRRAAAKVFPTLTGSGTSVDVRGVLREEYLSGTPLEKYTPSIIDAVPIISVRITVDTRENSEFAFQASPSTLDRLIKDLQAAQKDSIALQQHLGIKPPQ